MTYKVPLALLLLFCSNNVLAIDLEEQARFKAAQANVESDFSNEVKTMMNELGEIEAVRMLPINSVMLIQLKGKDPMFISSNGRFLIDGEIKDLWAMKPVKTVEQANDTWLLNLDKFANGTLLDQMAVVPFGNNKLEKQARVFISPLSKESQDFIKSLDPMTVNLDLIIMPHDKGSITPSMKAWCGYSALDTLQVLQTGEYQSVGQRNCNETDLKKVMTPMLMATYLDINKVPYFVRLDGKRHSGLPENTLDWLNNKQNVDVQKQSNQIEVTE